MRTAGVFAAIAAVVFVGCGGGTKTVTETTGSSASVAPSSASTTSGSGAAAQNNQVISAASQAPDNKAALGAAAIQKMLVTKLGLDSNLSFDLNHHITPDETAQNTGDCYVKLGPDAVNEEAGSPGNILRSPNGQDIVFVQSDTATPLVKCLVQVRDALGW